MDVLIAGATQDRHRQERILRSVRRGDEPETLAGVEPLDFGFDAATGGKVFAEEAGRRSYIGPLNVKLNAASARTLNHSVNASHCASTHMALAPPIQFDRRPLPRGCRPLPGE